VLDKRMREVVTSSNIPRERLLARTPNRQLKPLLALRYDAGGTPTISTGYETGSRVMIGRGERVVEEYGTWSIGGAIPCWYNPADSGDVVVVRGFGGSYLFALIPIGVLSLGVAGFRGRGSRNWRR
jgi:hypothetical protein